MRLGAIAVLIVAAGCAGRGAPIVSQPEPAYPTGNPIPVPQPVIERAYLGAELQELWYRVELAVDIRPPNPPNDATKQAVQQWADGPFRNWFQERKRATDHALEATYGLRTRPVYEQGVGTALFGYLYEDMVSGIRGAPVSHHIAEDKELLAAYTQTLTDNLKPYATYAAHAYYACLEKFVKLGDTRWGEWAAYCDYRGGEVVRVYDLVPPEPEVARDSSDR